MWHKFQYCFSLCLSGAWGCLLAAAEACLYSELQSHCWRGDKAGLMCLSRHVLACAGPDLLPHIPALSLARKLLEMASRNFCGLILKQLSETIQPFPLVEKSRPQEILAGNIPSTHKSSRLSTVFCTKACIPPISTPEFWISFVLFQVCAQMKVPALIVVRQDFKPCV